MSARTLVELMAANAAAPRGITYHSGEGQSRRVTYGELRTRALGVLHQLQQLGPWFAKSQTTCKSRLTI